MKQYIKPATTIVCLNAGDILEANVPVMSITNGQDPNNNNNEDGVFSKGHGFFDDWETPTGTNIWDDDDE